MTCPRCSADGILETAPGCPRCGFGFADSALSTAVAEEPVPEELAMALRRDLSGQYEITDLLGRGGMSLVYLAYEVELNRQVAIKVLPLQFMQGPSAAERFEREGKIAASLDHPHIVPIFRVGATGTFLWYTMKRIRGRSFEQVIAERGALPVAEVLKIVEQVGSALQYAHRHGVVHRDVKPANVMIEDSGWALVCDFGVARAFGSVGLTQTGHSLGTPRYMAPEQFEGQPVDGRGDQYSLAIMIWEALTGGLPFTGDSLGTLIRKHLLEPPPHLVEVNPEIPEHISAAVFRAMSKKPAERFPDIAAFVTALGGQTAPQIPSGFSGPVPAPARPPILWDRDTPTVPIVVPSHRRKIVALSIVVGVVLGAGGVWTALKPTAPVDGATPHETPLALDSSHSVTAAPTDTPVAAPPPEPRPQPQVTAPARARLSLSTQPPGTFFLDERAIRSTPILKFEMAPGRHRVQVKRDGFVSFDTVFTAAPGQEIRLTRKVLKPIGG